MRPVVLAILDGWGHSAVRAGNPIAEAKKPTFDMIAATYPATLLQASGSAVGLAWGEFGNSEVGHLTIGAGRTLFQYSLRINNAINDGSFFANPALAGAFDHARSTGGSVHITGLLTAGTVHAQFSHLLALLELSKKYPEIKTYVHLFTDGKDSGQKEAASLLAKLPISPTTLIGRDFAMDRDNNWDFTQIAYDLIATGKGLVADVFGDALAAYYLQGNNDTKIPALVTPSYEGIKNTDAIIFFNFREDSMRQLVAMFHDRSPGLFLAAMTEYLPDVGLHVAFPPPPVPNNLAELLATTGKRQLHIAETSKYAHVTYFFNGIRNNPYQGEDDVLLESVKNIEQSPEMGASQIADRVIAALAQNTYEFIVINFANADMLAHTGNFEATRYGIEAIDRAFATLLPAVLERDGILLITADHGNAEHLVNKITSEPESRHDDSPVPLYLVGREFTNIKLQISNEVTGILSDVAPTILELMGIAKPPEMTGVSLLPTLLGPGT
ncbi:MAG: 2,3-bisphosphoglycerate-independent phosphoglycerate mutase [Patescibacteria group bacterium]